MIVVAIPTIEARGEAWRERTEVWEAATPETVLVVPSWRPGGWAQGLNEVWEQHSDVEVFVCASDDHVPEAGWYEAALPWLERGYVVAPEVHDPRFSRWNGEPDGTPTRMSSFPILPKVVLPHVFPIESHEPQHYYADDLISDKARKGGHETVAVPSCVIHHLMDERGRGAGMGSEEARMAHDRAVYQKLTG